MKDRLWSYLFAFWCLSIAVVGTFLVAWIIYPIEIKLLNIEMMVFLKSETIQANFNHLMNYLLNPFSSPLNMPDFPSSQAAIEHFKDVKHLFIFAEAVLVILAYPSFRFFKGAREKNYLRLYRSVFLFMISLPLLIGLLAALIGFNQFFILFHGIFFPGQTNWLFDPATDPIILALPEMYFMHCFIIFFILYEGLFLSLFGLSKFEGKRSKRLQG